LSIDGAGTKFWKCNWCNETYAHWNATKALCHVTGFNNGKHISACQKIMSIPQQNRESYNDLLRRNGARKRSNEVANSTQEHMLEVHNNSSAMAFAEARKKKISGSISSISTERPKSISVGALSTASTGSKSVTGKGGMQLLLSSVGAGPVANAENQLTMAISDMIHSLGLPFSLGSEPKFRLVLSLARNVGIQYKLPSRNQIANELLDINYQQYTNKQKKQLLNKAEIYGLTFFGDGATVKKMPLLNILASGVHSPSSCLEIVECTGHISMGGKKDGIYIAQQFIPHIKIFETDKSNVVDLVIFDGASNVQRAGRIIAESYPRVSVIHGAEHVISLFFFQTCLNSRNCCHSSRFTR